MRYSTSFLHTEREFPKDEQAINARLLLRARFIDKLMAGVFSMLPLGFRVRDNIMRIIREEMNALGAEEVLLPALHPRTVWDATKRWEGMQSVMYQFSDSNGKDLGLGPTHEEIITPLVKKGVGSYTDLPVLLYQIQVKFRNEERPKSGLLRGREFTMKDLYSFHPDEESHNAFYEQSKKAYTKIFERCGLNTFVTEASGGDFSKAYSHEFMVEAPVGEDEIFVCRLCGFAQNTEIATHKKKAKCPQCTEGVLESIHSIEVGNIFHLGTRFSEAAHLYYQDADGNSKPVIMGSYGIGVERLIGTIVETHHDDKGMIWPESVAPFQVHLVSIGSPTKELTAFADSVYHALEKAGVTVLFDDRPDASAGEKFADADLIGNPYRIVISDKTLVQEKVELKKRSEDEAILVSLKEAIQQIMTS